MSVSYVINGGSALRGTLAVKGSPISAMAIMAASLLTTDKVTVQNVPHLHDLDRLLDELRSLGIAADWTHPHEITVFASSLRAAPRIHSNSLIGWSALLIGALTIRSEMVRLEVGELALLDDHLQLLLEVLDHFGGKSEWHEGMLTISLSHQHGADIQLDASQPEKTMLALLLAATAEGDSHLVGAAVDPEVEDLLDCIGAMGVYVHRAEDGLLTVAGKRGLNGTTHVLVSDRFEAAIFAVAALLTGGDILIQGARSAEMMSFLAKLQQLGAHFQVGRDGIRFWSEQRQVFHAAQLAVGPFPAMNQAWLNLFLPLLSRAEGESSIRTPQVDQWSHGLRLLQSVGAEVHVQPEVVRIFGPVKLVASKTAVVDFSSAIVGLLVGLSAGGTTELADMDELDGRFELLDGRLSDLGAKIRRQEK